MEGYVLKGETGQGYFVENVKDMVVWGKGKYDWTVLTARYYKEFMEPTGIVPEGFHFDSEAKALYAFVEGKKFDGEGNEIA